MPSATKRAASDAWTDQARPNENNARDQRLVIRGAGAGNDLRRYAYIYFDLPNEIKRGVTVRSATFRPAVKGNNWTTGRNITIRRVIESWKEGRIDYNNPPAVDATTYTFTSPTGLIEDDEFELDLTTLYQGVASGSAYYGLRVASDADAVLKLHSSESTRQGKRPELDVTWAKLPKPPNDLHPSGSKSVTLTRPILRWTFRDIFGDTTQAKSQVRIYNATTSALLYDSGLVANTDQQFDLANPPGGAPAFSALTSGLAVKWEVRVQDGDGLNSEYSDQNRFQYDSPGVLTITSPPAAVVNDLTPPITWTHTGRTQDQVELYLDVWDPDEQKFKKGIYHFRRSKHALGSLTIPRDYIRKQNLDYRIRLYVWDTLDREEQQGYVTASRTFRYVKDATPAVVTALSVTADGVIPKAAISFTRTARPDYFRLWQDGEVVLSHIDPDDIETSPGATTYSFNWWGVKPLVANSLDVTAVVNSAGSLFESAPTTASVTPRHIGRWLVDADMGVAVFIAGDDPNDDTIGESSETVYPVGRRSGVTIIDAIRGYEGSISGELIDFNGVTAEAYRDRFLRIRGRSGTTQTRLVSGDRNIPVTVKNMSVTPVPMGGAYIVGFDYEQVGEFLKLVR